MVIFADKNFIIGFFYDFSKETLRNFLNVDMSKF